MTTAHPPTSNETDECDDEAAWPLSYQICFPAQILGGPLSKRWWSHTLYRGPENKHVEVLYSKTKEDSEALAQKFLNEQIVGKNSSRLSFIAGLINSRV